MDPTKTPAEDESAFETDEADTVDPEEFGAEESGDVAGAPTRGFWGRWLKRIAIGFAALVLGFVLMAVALYNFGGMWLPDPALKAQYASLVASGQQPPIQARFTIPIPGCVCHSKDPVQTMQHATRHINECSQCHDKVGPQ